MKAHVYIPPPPLPTLVTLRVLLTTPSCVTVIMVTPPVAFAAVGKVQEGPRVGDGEEATQHRTKFVFSRMVVMLLRDTTKYGPGEERSPINNCYIDITFVLPQDQSKLPFILSSGGMRGVVIRGHEGVVLGGMRVWSLGGHWEDNRSHDRLYMYMTQCSP